MRRARENSVIWICKNAAALVLPAAFFVFGVGGSSIAQAQDSDPVADAGALVYFGTAGTPVRFDGSGSFDPDGGAIVSYVWDFDDGEEAAAAVVDHIYDEPGRYDVEIEVTDDEGSDDIDETVAIIAPVSGNDPPVATIDTPPDTTIRAGDTVFFTGTAEDDDGAILSVRWTFPGGDPASSPVEDPGNVTFDGPGTFLVTFEATDNFGATDADTVRIVVSPPPQPPTASITMPPGDLTVEAPANLSFTASGADPDGGPVTFSWVFPGGVPSTSTDQNPPLIRFSQPGTFTVTLTVTDDEGATAQDELTLTVTPAGGGGQPPVATIDAPPANVTIPAGGSVSFAGSGSDPDGGAVTFAWSFPGGNPASSSAEDPGSVVFPTPGSRRVTLTVTDDEGNGTEAQRLVNVTVANQLPQVTITLPAQSMVIRPGESVSFAGSAVDPDGSIVRYSWIFPGGSPASSSVQDPGAVAFGGTGVFIVRLTATDDDGSQGFAERTITVSAGPGTNLNVDVASPGSESRVDGHDVIFVLRAISTQDAGADVNEDGVVDEVDVQLVMAALGEVQ